MLATTVFMVFVWGCQDFPFRLEGYFYWVWDCSLTVHFFQLVRNVSLPSVCSEKYLIVLIVFPLEWGIFFVSLPSRYFPLSLVFRSLNRTCHGIDYFGAPCACVRLLVFGQIWGILSHYFFECLPRATFFLLFLCSKELVSEPLLSPWRPQGRSSLAFSLFSLCHSDWGISILWSGNSLVLSSLLSLLLLSPSAEFF